MKITRNRRPLVIVQAQELERMRDRFVAIMNKRITDLRESQNTWHPIVEFDANRIPDSRAIIEGFVAECTLVDPTARTPIFDLWVAYQNWLDTKDLGEKAERLNITIIVEFSKWLTRLGFKRSALKRGGKMTRVRQGLRLK